ncbi:MAG: hypothetical protein U1F76_15400 [Candidatus Competibacteraceae bacterium]
MNTTLMNAIPRMPASSESVHHFFSAAGAGRWMGVALACGFLVGGGLVSSVATAAGDQVTICHVPLGNPGNPQEITIGANAAAAHLKNHPGDKLGPCTPPPSGCPCADNGDPLWNNASALVPSFEAQGTVAPWACWIVTNQTVPQYVTFAGTMPDTTLRDVFPPASTLVGSVSGGGGIGNFCLGSGNNLLPIDATQEQACLQRMQQLAGQLGLTCVPHEMGGVEN